MNEMAMELVGELVKESGFSAGLRKRAAAVGAQVLLAEGEDPRVQAAALALSELGVARPLLVGPASKLRRAVTEMGADPGAIPIIDPDEDERARAVGARLFDRRRAKGLTQGEAMVLARQPLQLGAGLVAMGHCDAMVAGAANATGDVIRAGLYHAGLADGISVVSGSFLMVPPAHGPLDRPLIFADSAVLPDPDEDQLVSVGVASAESFRRLVGREPKLACLSFSTKGSADHPSAVCMAKVAQRLRELGVEADGELQLDAALVPEVGKSKAPDSAVAGQADVLIFPDLNSGNIGYKIAQRLGRMEAIGPIVQGLARPIFDLSRGCSAADIVNTAAIAALFKK